MFLKQSTAYTFRFGPFLDDTDGKTAETGLTISQADVRLSKNGGNFAQKNESSSSSHDEIGYYIVVLDTTDTNTVGELLVAVHESGALPVFKTFQVVEEAIYDAVFAASATLVTKIDAIDTVVDAVKVVTDAISTNGSGLSAVPWNSSWDAEVQSEVADALVAIGLDHLVSASVAGSDVVDNSIVAKLVSKESTADWDDFVNTTDSLQALRDRGDAAWTTGSGGSAPTAAAIADAVWDEAASGHNTGGTFGKYVRQLKEGTISVESAVNDASATTTSFVTDLTEATDDHYIGKTLAFTSGNLSSQSRIISDYNGTTKAITFDEALTEAPADNDEFIILSTHAHTVTEIKEAVRTEMDSNSTKLAAIVADTAEIGTAGAGLTAVPWNASWDAEVQSECTDALNAYDPPTKAEMDAMWTTAMTESYASDGAAMTPAQALYMILCSVSEFSISSTTITGKKLDGSTTAMTWTINDASNPTSRTRAS